MTAEYCANNWKVDPVRCSAFVPKGYQPATQNQQIEQDNIPSSSASDANRICPYGSYLGKDAFGNQACLDSKTNQVVSSPNLGQSVSGSARSSSTGLGNSGTAAGIVVFLIIIVIIAAVAKSRRKPSSISYKDVARKSFTYQTKEMIKRQQRGKCASCGKYPTHWEFDHINGRGDNSMENCQGLCRDCHQDKTLNDGW